MTLAKGGLAKTKAIRTSIRIPLFQVELARSTRVAALSFDVGFT